MQSTRALLLAAFGAACVAGPRLIHAQDTTRVRDALRVRDSLRVRNALRLADSLAQRDTLRLRDSLQRMGDTLRTRGTTSEQRIPVRKESRGEVDLAESRARADSLALEQARRESIGRAETARQDSIAGIERARTDSLANLERIRQDSVNAVEAARRDSVARADSIANEEQLRQQRMRDRYLFNGTGWYLGVSGGGAVPTGEFSDVGYGNGYTLNVPIGWHARGRLVGVRLDLGYTQFAGQSFVGIGAGGAPLTLSNDDPKVLSATLNLTARIPLNPARTFHLYGVGGAGIYQFRDFGPTSALSGFLGNDVISANSASSRNAWGGQVGAGFDFGVGPASLFVESRLVNVVAERGSNSTAFRNVFGDRGKDVRWVPIVLGVTFR